MRMHFDHVDIFNLDRRYISICNSPTCRETCHPLYDWLLFSLISRILLSTKYHTIMSYHLGLCFTLILSDLIKNVEPTSSLYAFWTQRLFSLIIEYNGTTSEGEHVLCFFPFRRPPCAKGATL